MAEYFIFQCRQNETTAYGTDGRYPVSDAHPLPVVGMAGGSGTAGDVAAGATDSGNPVKTGGYSSNTPPTAVTSGQRANAWYGLNGQQVATTLAVIAISDAMTVRASTDPGGTGAVGGAAVLAFNGGNANTGYDRWRNNLSATPLALAVASKATRTSADQVNFNGSGLLAAVTVANLAGAATFLLSFQWKTNSGAYVTLWAAPVAVGANGTYVYEPSEIVVGRTYRWVLTYAGNGTTDAADTTLDVDNVVSQPPTGPWTPYHNTALSNTGVLVKGAVGILGGYCLCNNSATAVFVHLYDKATAPGTGTDVPKQTILVPANSVVQRATPANGTMFINGIGVSCTALVGDADNTAPGTAALVNLEYK